MRHPKELRILPLAAAGLLWTALATVPAVAQKPVVEKQTSSTTAGSGSKPSRTKSSARSSGSSRSSNARSARSASTPRAESRARSSAPSYRPRGELRETRREHRVHDRSHRYYDRSRQREVRHRDRHRYHHRSSHYGHYRGRYNYHYPRYRSPYYSYYGAFGFWYPGWVNAYWERPYYSRRPVAVYVDNYESGRLGALDLDVSPEKAEIFIDGNRVGVADNYDGFPTFLWLEEGTYDVAIYMPGFETIFRQYTIYPGVVIDVEDRMQPGESVHPDDYGPKSTVNRDERLRRNQEREEAARELEAPAPPEDSREVVEESRPTGEDIGRLALEIYPPDAAVYMDGYFLGTASEVTGIRAGLLVDPGEHYLEITRPGYVTREIEFTVSSGERMDLVIELEEEGK